MNIKRAKQEIKDTIQAYLLRDDTALTRFRPSGSGRCC